MDLVSAARRSWNSILETGCQCQAILGRIHDTTAEVQRRSMTLLFDLGGGSEAAEHQTTSRPRPNANTTSSAPY